MSKVEVNKFLKLPLYKKINQFDSKAQTDMREVNWYGTCNIQA